LAAGAKPAKFFCADHIATTAVEKKKLRAETGVDAVEMESGRFMPFAASGDSLCHHPGDFRHGKRGFAAGFQCTVEAGLSLDYGKLAWAIARSPGKISALLKLQKQTRFAAERLASVLEKIVSA